MIEWKGKPEEENREQEQDQEGEGKQLTLIDLEYFYDLLMEQHEQM